MQRGYSRLAMAAMPAGGLIVGVLVALAPWLVVLATTVAGSHAPVSLALALTPYILTPPAPVMAQAPFFAAGGTLAGVLLAPLCAGRTIATSRLQIAIAVLLIGGMATAQIAVDTVLDRPLSRVTRKPVWLGAGGWDAARVMHYQVEDLRRYHPLVGLDWNCTPMPPPCPYCVPDRAYLYPVTPTTALGADLSSCGVALRAEAPLDLRFARFHRAHIRVLSIAGSDLRGADFRESRFHNVRLAERRERIDFRGSRFDGAYILGGDLSRGDFRGASFDGAVLQNVRFSRSGTEGVDFSNAQLFDVTFDTTSH